MRRAAVLVFTLLAIQLALVAGASASTPTDSVVGGSDATTATAPWQALVLPAGYLCGGAILDETHVATAAHCVYDDVHLRVIDPGTVTIRAGIVNRRLAGGQAGVVTAISVYPGYAPDLETGDVAVLTLASPLAWTPEVQPIALSDVGWRPEAGVTDLRLSGWGSTVARSPTDATSAVTTADVLQVTTIRATDLCSSAYAPFDDELLLCAGEPGLDACQGDSGGPLAVQDHGTWELAGIVTGGAGCAWAGYPGFYARVAHAGLHAFLADRGAGSRLEDPRFTRPPEITGDAVAGGTLACDHGDAINAYALATGFVENGVVVARDDRLALGPRDVGATVTCVAVAYGLTGSARATSAPVIVRAAAAAPAPPPAVSPYAPAHDTASPVARIVRARCGRHTCTLDVRVEDPAPSAGVKGIEARVDTAYRTTCRVKGGHRRCTRVVSQRLRTAATATAFVYRIVTPPLRRGVHTFTIVAADLAGHRQARPTTLRRTTR